MDWLVGWKGLAPRSSKLRPLSSMCWCCGSAATARCITALHNALLLSRYDAAFGVVCCFAFTGFHWQGLVLFQGVVSKKWSEWSPTGLQLPPPQVVLIGFKWSPSGSQVISAISSLWGKTTYCKYVGTLHIVHPLSCRGGGCKNSVVLASHELNKAGPRETSLSPCSGFLMMYWPRKSLFFSREA